MARRVTGSSRLRRQMRQWPDHLTEDVKREIRTAGIILAAEVSARAPKDSGDMAAAARYKVSSDGLGVSVGYSRKASGFARLYKKGGFKALFQEFGTEHHAAQAFIRPAWKAKIKGILDRIDAAVNQAIKKAGNL